MELTETKFHSVSRLFTELNHHISIKGVLSSRIAGRVFADYEYTTAVVLSPEGIF